MPVLVNAEPINTAPDIAGEIMAMLVGAATDQEDAQQEDA